MRSWPLPPEHGDQPASVRYCSDAGEPGNVDRLFQDYDVGPGMVKGRSTLRLAHAVGNVGGGNTAELATYVEKGKPLLLLAE